MHLFLMRHGIAMDREDPACPPDPERPLTGKGERRTREVAQVLKKFKIAPDVILSSPYLRAIQTARIVAKAFGSDPRRIVKTNSLRPEADPSALFGELVLFHDSNVFCTGHAPNLDLIVAEIVGLSGIPITSLKKAGVACLQVDAFDPPAGMLQWLAETRFLRSLNGKG